MKFTVLVPARLASTRLPDKPLADIAGLPMVVRVARRAAASGAVCVVVAGDDERIVQVCAQAGVQALLTRKDHLSGSDRLAEACALLGLDGDEIIVNVQGDEPLIDPALVRQCAELLTARPDCVMSTAAHAIDNLADYTNPNVVKLVLDAQQRALYFSRAPLPFWRDGPRQDQPVSNAAGAGMSPRATALNPQWRAASSAASSTRFDIAALPHPRPLRHIGLYAYRASFLRAFPGMAVAPLEVTESLEQLRVLWHGHRIAVHVTEQAPGAGVDTPADLARVRALFEETPVAPMR